jgi:hypothetical protein
MGKGEEEGEKRKENESSAVGGRSLENYRLKNDKLNSRAEATPSIFNQQ